MEYGSVQAAWRLQGLVPSPSSATTADTRAIPRGSAQKQKKKRKSKIQRSLGIASSNATSAVERDRRSMRPTFPQFLWRSMEKTHIKP